MAVYLVERDTFQISADQLNAMLGAAVEMSHRFAIAGRPVHYLRSIYVPSESRCLSLFEAASAVLVRDVNEAAQIPFTRIVEAIELAGHEQIGRSDL